MSSSGSPRILKVRMDMPRRPANLIRLEKGLSVLAQRLTDFEHRPKLLPHRTRCFAAFVHRPCDLVDIPADGGELSDAALERQELLLRQRHQRAQMRTGEHGYIGCRPHSARLRPRVPQPPILVAKSHEHRPRAHGRFTGRPAMTMNAVGLVDFSSGRTAGFGRANLPNDQPLEPRRFRQKVSIDDCFNLAFDLHRDSRLQEFRTTHGPQCGPLASRRLSCLSGKMRHKPASLRRGYFYP